MITETEELAKPMRRFQESEVKRLRLLTSTLRELHKAVTSLYPQFTLEQPQAEQRQALEPLMDRFAVSYRSYLEEELLAAAKEAAEGSRKLMEKVGVAVEQRYNLSPVNVNLRLVPERVVQRAFSRGRGEVGASLSDRIWQLGQIGETQVLAGIQHALANGLSPQQFGKLMEPYLLPGREFPKKVPSSIVANQPRSLAYNAFRLARTEINHVYNEARAELDKALADKGVVAGTRWLLSKSHKARLARLGLSADICDEYANRLDPNLAWLADYGIDPKGVWEVGTAPVEHPNGLCLLVPVPTPDALREKALRGEELSR